MKKHTLFCPFRRNSIAATLAFQLLVATTLTACGNFGQPPTPETPLPDTLTQEVPTDTAPEVPECKAYSDTPFILDAEDTLLYKGYTFASFPIPDAVKARMEGKSMKDNPHIGYDQLRYLTVYHYDYEGRIQKGKIVCNKRIARDLLCVFRDLVAKEYPICSIRLIDDFDGDDNASMEANNTSCFNYRVVPGTRALSKHALGLAIDVNPLQNPYIAGSQVYPPTATEYVDRTKDFPHKIDKNDLCFKVFTSYGFTWGGIWRNKDYQHFEKRR